jgi:RNA polymerase sigma factor (sigma-70 family)
VANIDEKLRSEIEKLLTQRFAASSLDGYVSIAVGEAYSKLLGKEIQSGEVLDDFARKNFLYTVARNSILNEIRRMNKHERLGQSTGSVHSVYIDTDSEKNLHEKLFVEQLLKALPSKQSVVVAMYYMEELDVKQIAEEIGISVDGVKKRLKEALKALRQKNNI